ncbi:MAG: hypothetical protein RSE32_13180 [Comamonas sp.]
MKNYIQYRAVLIAKNSHAYELWEAKDFKALDKHLAALAKAEEELRNRY